MATRANGVFVPVRPAAGARVPGRPDHLAHRRPVPLRPVAPRGPAAGARRPAAGHLPAGTWTDWWTRERSSGPRWVDVEHGLETMPLYLREGAVIAMGPVVRWVGELPTDPLTVVVAPFGRAGLTERHVPVDGGDVTIRYTARAGRHTVEVEGHPGAVVLDAPLGVEVRR